MTKQNIEVAEFGVLRMPRMSLALLDNLPHNKAELTAYLKHWLEMDGVLEAIYLASPSLTDRIPAWKSKPDSKAGQKVQSALLKYLIRMSSRPTPFGLFSGIAMIELSAQTNLFVSDDYKRHTRLDTYFLSSIKEALSKVERAPVKSRYYPNSTLYSVGNAYRYIEHYRVDNVKKFKLSEVARSDCLSSVLSFASAGAAVDALCDFIFEQYPEVSNSEALEFIHQLIINQVLISELFIPLISSETDKDFSKNLSLIGAYGFSRQIDEAMQKIRSFDKARGAAPAEYRRVYEDLKGLDVPIEENKLFQVDTYRKMNDRQFSKRISDSVLDCIFMLAKYNKENKNTLSNFVSHFHHRFDGQFVPLLKLLDDEDGISWHNSSYQTSLLQGLGIEKKKSDASAYALEDAFAQLSAKHVQNDCIRLEEFTTQNNTGATDGISKLSASFAAVVSLYLDHDDNEIINFSGCYGPSAANWLGRFCHLDDKLLENMRQLLQQESATSPDVLFAEIVHLPDERQGNVICRPALREYEISFMDSYNSEKNIPLTDIYVFIEDGVIKLWSKKLHKQIVPRLSSAHNFIDHSLGIYRFLGMLQLQDTVIPRFSISYSAEKIVYVPRVQYKNIILQEAQWSVKRKYIEDLVVGVEFRKSAWDELYLIYRIDRHVSYSVHDHTLTIDLWNPILVNLLLSETSGKKSFVLKESLIKKLKPILSGNDGGYSNELIIPYINNSVQPITTLKPPKTNQLQPSERRAFCPGSEWLNIKIYAAPNTAEQVIFQVIQPFIECCRNQKWFEKWFFIRFGDPEWHIRLRFYGLPSQLYSQVLVKLKEVLDPWMDGFRVKRLELFTYEREIERYGGMVAIDTVEHIFMLESDFVLDFLKVAATGDDCMRVRLAICATHIMLSSLILSVNERLNFVDSLRGNLAAEFADTPSFRAKLGQKYQQFKSFIVKDLALIEDADLQECAVDARITSICTIFKRKLLPLTAILANQLNSIQSVTSPEIVLTSILHMLNNRIFIAHGREQEFVIYDMLRRYYLFSQARLKDKHSEDIAVS